MQSSRPFPWDTAQSYFNEEAVGQALSETEVPRDQIFLTTKVWIDNYGSEKTKESVMQSLKKLHTDYLDLLLLHQPFSDYYGAYRAIEDLYKEGVLRAIGVSNFAPDRLMDISLFNEIKPMVNQVEVNLFQQQKAALKTMHELGVQPEVWGRLGSLSYTSREGTHVHQDSFTSAIGRLGIVLGKKQVQGENPHDFYLKASLLHEFGGERNYSLSRLNRHGDEESLTGSHDYRDTWVEVGFGGNMKINDRTTFYGDVERSFGGDYRKKWQFNLGLSWSF